MSARRANRILIVLSTAVILVTASVVVLGVRTEDTRNIVERSPCQIDPSSDECQRVSRETTREKSVRDSCIPFRKVMTVAAYRKSTICPDRNVVIANSKETRDGFNGSDGAVNPPPGGSPGPGRTDAQKKRHDGNTVPSTPVTPPKEPNAPKPSDPSPSPVPGAPSPEPSPVPVAPQVAPLIDVSPVVTPVGGSRTIKSEKFEQRSDQSPPLSWRASIPSLRPRSKPFGLASRSQTSNR